MSSVFIYFYPIFLNYFKIFSVKFRHMFTIILLPTQSYALRRNATKKENTPAHFLEG